MKSTKVWICSLLSLMCVLPGRPQTTEESNETLSMVSLNPPDDRELTDEDKYVQFFENDHSWYHSWKIVARWIQDNDNATLKKLCGEAHFRRGFGVSIVYTVCMNARKLLFKNEKYNPMKIDVVTYVIKDYGYYGDTDVASNRYHITEGARVDCVFFLKAVNVNETEFYIDQHVCGLIIN